MIIFACYMRELEFLIARNVVKRDQEAVGRSDGGSDHGTSGENEDSALAPVVRGRKGTHAKLLNGQKAAMDMFV